MDDSSVRVAEYLAARSWFVGDGFLGAPELDDLEVHAYAAYDDGTLRPAGVGRGRDRRRLPSVRGDVIRWIDPLTAPPALRPFLERVEALRLTLNRELCAGLWDVEVQLAAYDPGARYRRHLDQFVGVQARLVTLILYLNRDWQASHGGALRLHVDAEPGFVDVLPERGRFVVFRSDVVEHEVLPATRRRFSLTAWYRRRTDVVPAGA